MVAQVPMKEARPLAQVAPMALMAAVHIKVTAVQVKELPLENSANQMEDYTPVVAVEDTKSAPLQALVVKAAVAQEVVLKTLAVLVQRILEAVPAALLTTIHQVRILSQAVLASSSSATHGRWRSNGKNHGRN